MADAAAVASKDLSNNASASNTEKIKMMLDEILTAERNYCNNLDVLWNKFGVPLRKMAQHGEIDLASISRIFANLQDLMHFHGLLNSEIQNQTNAAGVADTFVKFAEFFKMYSLYVNGYDRRCDCVDTLRKSSRFQKFITEVRKDKATQGNNITSFLIMPVQRIPLYELLLSQMLKLVESAIESPDASCLEIVGDNGLKKAQEAVQKMKEIGQFINENKRNSEKQDKLLELQSRLQGDDTLALVTPHRHLIREGEMLKLSTFNFRRARKFFLFNDLLLWTTTSYKVRGYIDLAPCQVYAPGITLGGLGSGAVISTGMESHMNVLQGGFEIIHPRHNSVICYCANDDERRSWVHDIVTAIKLSVSDVIDGRRFSVTPSSTALADDEAHRAAGKARLLNRSSVISNSVIGTGDETGAAQARGSPVMHSLSGSPSASAQSSPRLSSHGVPSPGRGSDEKKQPLGVIFYPEEPRADDDEITRTLMPLAEQQRIELESEDAPLDFDASKPLDTNFSKEFSITLASIAGSPDSPLNSPHTLATSAEQSSFGYAQQKLKMVPRRAVLGQDSPMATTTVKTASKPSPTPMDISAAENELKACTLALQKIEHQDFLQDCALTDLEHFTPHIVVRKVLEAACIILGVDPSENPKLRKRSTPDYWSSAVHLVEKPHFLRLLIGHSEKRLRIPPTAMQILRQNYISNPLLHPKLVARSSRHAGHIWDWARARFAFQAREEGMGPVRPTSASSNQLLSPAVVRSGSIDYSNLIKAGLSGPPVAPLSESKGQAVDYEMGDTPPSFTNSSRRIRQPQPAGDHRRSKSSVPKKTGNGSESPSIFGKTPIAPAP